MNGMCIAVTDIDASTKRVVFGLRTFNAILFRNTLCLVSNATETYTLCEYNTIWIHMDFVFFMPFNTTIQVKYACVRYFDLYFISTFKNGVIGVWVNLVSFMWQPVLKHMARSPTGCNTYLPFSLCCNHVSRLFWRLGSKLLTWFNFIRLKPYMSSKVCDEIIHSKT